MRASIISGCKLHVSVFDMAVWKVPTTQHVILYTRTLRSFSHVVEQQRCSERSSGGAVSRDSAWNCCSTVDIDSDPLFAALAKKGLQGFYDKITTDLRVTRVEI
jgi:hypothetical protein